MCRVKDQIRRLRCRRVKELPSKVFKRRGGDGRMRRGGEKKLEPSSANRTRRPSGLGSASSIPTFSQVNAHTHVSPAIDPAARLLIEIIIARRSNPTGITGFSFCQSVPNNEISATGRCVLIVGITCGHAVGDHTITQQRLFVRPTR